MKAFISNILIKTAQNRIVQHLLFWALSVYVLFKLFNTSSDMQITDLIYTLLFHISLLTLVYLNIFLIIPQLLSRSYYLLYLLSAGGLILVTSLFNQFTFTTLTDWIFPGYYFISYYELKDILQFMGAYWAISTALKLSKAWFKVNEKEKKIRILEQQKTRAELQALKAQLNPHFLFNSLNNIYSLALYEDKKTPEALLKLSHCLRYVLYDCKHPEIPLAKEIEMIRNYIDLHEMRSAPRPNISFEVHGELKEQKLSPLLFLPLVENAFKHCKPDSHKNRFIKLQMLIEEEKIDFQINNSKNDQIEVVKEVGGVGIENLKKRLELLYPNQYFFQKTNLADLFSAQLIINFKAQAND